MNKKTLAISILIVAAAAAAYFINSTRGATAEAESSTLYGNVDIRQVALAFRQAGRISSVDVEEGDSVAAGDSIASLDDETFREALTAAEARVELARARLERLQRGSRSQEIEQARAIVSEAKVRLLAADQELERKLGLLEAGASSQRDVEAASERRDSARARLGGAQQAVSLATAGSRTEDVAAGRAQLKLVEAQLEQARTTLDDARLRSPSAGIVLTRAREPGSMVAVGAPIATLSLHEPVVVRAYAPEPLLDRVAPGTVVEITTDSAVGGSYRGHIGFVSSRAEFTPKTVETPDLRTDLVYRLRIIVDDPDKGLRQGMPVTVHLPDTHNASTNTASAG